MQINNKYNFSDTVYLKHDPEQTEWMVTSITVYPIGISYTISSGKDVIDVYEMELSNEKNVLKQFNRE